MWQLKSLGDVVSQFLFFVISPRSMSFICNIHGNDALILGFKWHELHYWGMNRHMLDVKHSQILEIRQKLRGQAMHMNFTFYDWIVITVLKSFWNYYRTRWCAVLWQFSKWFYKCHLFDVLTRFLDEISVLRGFVIQFPEIQQRSALTKRILNERNVFKLRPCRATVD